MCLNRASLVQTIAQNFIRCVREVELVRSISPPKPGYGFVDKA